MTCEVQVMAPGSSVLQARALLDCAALTSLITEYLAHYRTTHSIKSCVYHDTLAILPRTELLVTTSAHGEP